MIKEIAHIIANQVDYETHGQWTLPVITGDKIDIAASGIDTLTRGHYFEFTKWKDSKYFSISGTYFERQEDPVEFIKVPRFTLDELYNYWLKNIKDK